MNNFSNNYFDFEKGVPDESKYDFSREDISKEIEPDQEGTF